MEHNLTITQDGKATCSCGEEFAGPNEKAVVAWRAHVEVPKLLEEVKAVAEAEMLARLQSENLVRRLFKLGASAPTISKFIGDDSEGRPILSTTSIQRIVKSNNSTPRRRYRKAVAATPAKKTTTRRTTKKAT